MKVVVLHAGYGCDTGCCGHVVRPSDGKDAYDDGTIGDFEFEHPYSAKTDEERKEWAIDFARKVIETECGANHAFDLDWENCVISTD